MNKKPVGTTYVCGAVIEFDSKGQKFAMDVMGQFSTVDEAVVANSKLHSAFGHDIYEVDDQVTKTLVRTCGLRQGSKGAGIKVIKFVCKAYNHPAWPGQSIGD